MVLAGSVFSERISKNRHLVFFSCDNCRPYGLDPLQFSDKLQKQNVVVSSIGDYRLIDLDTYGRDERPIGNYDNDVFFYVDDSKRNSSEHYLRSYKLDHDVDLCTSLAIKTGGLVEAKDGESMTEVAGLVQKQSKAEYSYKADKCEKVSTEYGDFTGFSYLRNEKTAPETKDE